MKNEKVTDSSSEVLNLSDSECGYCIKQPKVAKNEVIIEIGITSVTLRNGWLKERRKEINANFTACNPALM